MRIAIIAHLKHAISEPFAGPSLRLSPSRHKAVLGCGKSDRTNLQQCDLDGSEDTFDKAKPLSLTGFNVPVLRCLPKDLLEQNR